MDKGEILVVDDSSITQDTLKGHFEAMGCQVTVVPSAESARVVLETAHIPDIMILDFQLKGQTGPTFYDWIIKNKAFQKIAVIPISSNWDPKNLPKLTRDWLGASFRAEAITGKNTPYVVGKDKEEGEHMKTVPLLLTFLVGKELRSQGKILSETFKQAVEEAQQKMGRAYYA